MNAPDPHARFLALVRQMGAARRVDYDYRLYEMLKSEYRRLFPDASPEQDTAMMQAISRAAGV